MPEATEGLGDGMMMKPDHEPSFAEYWNPPTDFYGQPIYGSTLRIN